MSTIGNNHSRSAIGDSLHILMWCVLLTGAIYGQEKQSQPETLPYAVDRANLPHAIASVKSGDFGPSDVELIARVGAVEAVPMLEEKFGRTEDALDKAHIASALVRLGDKKDIFWDFLVEQATQAVESDAPNFMGHDSQGKSVPGPSPEFEAWVRAHNLDPTGLGEKQMYLAPGPVAFIALTRDARAVPLLRRGLLSPNYMIEIVAAKGLAEIGDKDSIPLIIEACKKAPAEEAAAIAESLVYFDDHDAQSAVDRYISKDAAKIYREARAHGRKPFGN